MSVKTAIELTLQIALLDPLLVQLPYFWLGIYRAERDRVRRVAYRGPVPPCHEFAYGQGNVGLTAQSGLRKVIPDVSEDAQYSQCFIATQSECVIPIHFEGRLVGVIDAESDRPDDFTAEDEVRLNELASLAAPVLAMPYWEQAVECLEAMYELRSTFPYFDWAGVYRLDEQKPEELVLTCQLGAPTPHMRIAVAQGICGAAVREGRSLNIPDVRADERFIACSISTRSELVVPIRDRAGQIVGEIDIDSDRENAFGSEAQAAVEAIAYRLGQSWRNAS